MTKTAKQTSRCTLQLSRKNQKPIQNEFNTTIAETIDESLSSFCNLDKEAVYHRLENDFRIKKQEIPYKLEECTDALEQIFGVGAKLIEIRTMQTLHNRIQGFMFFPKKGDIDFKEYAASLRAFLQHAL